MNTNFTIEIKPNLTKITNDTPFDLRICKLPVGVARNLKFVETIPAGSFRVYEFPIQIEKYHFVFKKRID